MREVLLHGGVDEAFDRSVEFARRLAESFGARLHVLYTRGGSAVGGLDGGGQRGAHAGGAPGDGGGGARAAGAVHPARGAGAARGRRSPSAPARPTRRWSATPTSTPSTWRSSRQPRRRRAGRSGACRSRRRPVRRARPALTADDRAGAAGLRLCERMVPDGRRRGRDPLVLARSARHHPARALQRPAGGWRRVWRQRPLRDRVDRALRGGHPSLRGDRARSGRSRAPGSPRRSSTATARCTARAWRTRSRRGRTDGWSAGCTAWRSAARSSASRCSTARPTRRRSRWSRWSSACAARGYVLLDTQWVTPHLEQFGAIEIPRARVPAAARAGAAASSCRLRVSATRRLSGPCRARSA